MVQLLGPPCWASYAAHARGLGLAVDEVTRRGAARRRAFAIYALTGLARLHVTVSPAPRAAGRTRSSAWSWPGGAPPASSPCRRWSARRRSASEKEDLVEQAFVHDLLARAHAVNLASVSGAQPLARRSLARRARGRRPGHVSGQTTCGCDCDPKPSASASSSACWHLVLLVARAVMRQAIGPVSTAPSRRDSSAGSLMPVPVDIWEKEQWSALEVH